MSVNKARATTPRRSCAAAIASPGGPGDFVGLKREASSSNVSATNKSENAKGGGNPGNELGSGGGASSGNKGVNQGTGAKGVSISKQSMAGSASGASNSEGDGRNLLQSTFASSLCKSDNTDEAGTNEKIMKEIHSFYNLGLVRAARTAKVEINKPKRQVVILLVGNHSAGKSSFINWYTQDSVMKTGVAIETQGINFILHGSRRETLKGSATLQLFPELGKLRSIPGVVANLVTEVSPSRARVFQSIVFIDTPGLVDGSMNYPFDINKTLSTLGEMADMIFFFFEPIGQALCKRTVDILEEMWSVSGDSKIRLYLSKADEAGGDCDRQKVMMQIAQELCKRPKINRSGFDMPAIYIPGIAPEITRGSSSLFSNRNPPATRCTNQIDETCKEIEKAVKMNVQNALDSLENDNDEVLKKIQEKLTDDDAAKKEKARLMQKKVAVVLVALCVFAVILASSVVEEFEFQEYAVVSKFGKSLQSLISTFALFKMDGLPGKWRDRLFSNWNWLRIVGAACLLMAFNKIQDMIFCPSVNVMGKGDRKELEEKMKDLQNIKSKQKILYKMFLAQSIPDIELEEVRD